MRSELLNLKSSDPRIDPLHNSEFLMYLRSQLLPPIPDASHKHTGTEPFSTADGIPWANLFPPAMIGDFLADTAVGKDWIDVIGKNWSSIMGGNPFGGDGTNSAGGIASLFGPDFVDYCYLQHLYDKHEKHEKGTGEHGDEDYIHSLMGAHGSDLHGINTSHYDPYFLQQFLKATWLELVWPFANDTSGAPKYSISKKQEIGLSLKLTAGNDNTNLRYINTGLGSHVTSLSGNTSSGGLAQKLQRACLLVLNLLAAELGGHHSIGGNTNTKSTENYLREKYGSVFTTLISSRRHTPFSTSTPESVTYSWVELPEISFDQFCHLFAVFFVQIYRTESELLQGDLRRIHGEIEQYMPVREDVAVAENKTTTTVDTDDKPDPTVSGKPSVSLFAPVESIFGPNAVEGRTIAPVKTIAPVSVKASEQAAPAPPSPPTLGATPKSSTGMPPSVLPSEIPGMPPSAPIDRRHTADSPDSVVKSTAGNSKTSSKLDSTSNSKASNGYGLATSPKSPSIASASPPARAHTDGDVMRSHSAMIRSQSSGSNESLSTSFVVHPSIFSSANDGSPGDDGKSHVVSLRTAVRESEMKGEDGNIKKINDSYLRPDRAAKAIIYSDRSPVAKSPEKKKVIVRRSGENIRIKAFDADGMDGGSFEKLINDENTSTSEKTDFEAAAQNAAQINAQMNAKINAKIGTTNFSGDSSTNANVVTQKPSPSRNLLIETKFSFATTPPLTSPPLMNNDPQALTGSLSQPPQSSPEVQHKFCDHFTIHKEERATSREKILPGFRQMIDIEESPEPRAITPKVVYEKPGRTVSDELEEITEAIKGEGKNSSSSSFPELLRGAPTVTDMKQKTDSEVEVQGVKQMQDLKRKIPPKDVITKEPPHKEAHHQLAIPSTSIRSAFISKANVNFFRTYQMIRSLGSGSFGKCELVLDKRKFAIHEGEADNEDEFEDEGTVV